MLLVDDEYIASGNARVKYRSWAGTLVAVIECVDPQTFAPMRCAKVKFDNIGTILVDWHLLEKYDG